MSKGNVAGAMMDVIKTPLGVIMLLIICIVLAGLSVATAISGQLTAAAVSAAGLITLVVLLVVIKVIAS